MHYTLIFALSLWSSVIFAAFADTGATSSEPETPSTKGYQLCLYINSISMHDPSPSSTFQNSDTDATAIFYVYDSTSSGETMQSLSFPLSTELEKDIEEAAELAGALSLTLPDLNPKVGCWTEPQFHELLVRFKVYQYYHVALKAASSVLVPVISKGPATQRIILETLGGESHEVEVEVELTLSWSKVGDKGLSAPITPLQPIHSFDSDDVTDALIQVENEPVVDDQDVVMSLNQDHMEQNQQTSETTEGSTDWMFTAACMSAVLGAIVLCWVCIGVYRRSGYEPIGYPTKCSKLKGIQRISLRNIGRSDLEEQRSVMHPSGRLASYTFDD